MKSVFPRTIWKINLKNMQDTKDYIDQFSKNTCLPAWLNQKIPLFIAGEKCKN